MLKNINIISCLFDQANLLFNKQRILLNLQNCNNKYIYFFKIYMFYFNKNKFFFKFFNSIVKKNKTYLKKKKILKIIKSETSKEIIYSKFSYNINKIKINKWYSIKKNNFKYSTKYKKNIYILEKFWKFMFLDKTKNINFFNFLKNLKEKITVSKFVFANYLFNINTNKKSKFLFLCFKNLKNTNFIKQFTIYNKFVNFKKTDKFKYIYAFIIICNTKKYKFMFNNQYVNFFFKKYNKNKKKKFINVKYMYKQKNLKKTRIKRFKKKFWIKKVNLDNFKNFKKYIKIKHTHSNQTYKHINVNIFNKNIKNHNNNFTQYLFNMWNIRSYNWKQIT